MAPARIQQALDDPTPKADLIALISESAQPEPAPAAEPALEPGEASWVPGTDEEHIIVFVPAGLASGDAMRLTLGNGDVVEIEVPDGLGAGDEFEAFVEKPDVEAEPTQEFAPPAREAQWERGTDDEHIIVTIPAGLGSGDTVSLTLANGELLEVEVPESDQHGWSPEGGLQAGDEFEAFVEKLEPDIDVIIRGERRDWRRFEHWFE